MMIESIYLSKLEELQSIISSKAAKCSCASSVFSDLLDAIEQRMNLSGTADSSITVSGTQTGKLVQTGDEIETAIQNAANKTGLDADLIRAVIQVESSFNTDAVSTAGAQGLMQLMPGTAEYLGVEDPFDACENVLGGATYLAQQIKRFGDVRLALAAYNTGPSKIASLGIADADDPEEYEKISSGVRGYVKKVLSYYEQYSQS